MTGLSAREPAGNAPHGETSGTHLAIVGGTFLTMEPSRPRIEDGFLLSRDGVITAVGERRDLPSPGTGVDVIDANGMLVTPGLVNTHAHLVQGLIKGLGDDRPLDRWLGEVTIPAGAVLTEDDCESAALFGAVEAIRSGTTTIAEFLYTHPRPYLTDSVVRGLQHAGIRAVVGRGFMTNGADRGIPEGLLEATDAIANDVARLAGLHNRVGALVTIGIAPCLIYVVDEVALIATRELAEELDLLTSYHLSETTTETRLALQAYGMSETAWLEQLDLLAPSFLAVHCTHVSREDVARLRHHDVRVSHNPIINMYLAAGIAPVVDLRRTGITVGLATDGPASNNNQNMVRVLKFTALLHKVAQADPEALSAMQVLDMATLGGARALGLEKSVGSLEIGKKADVSIFDFDNPFVGPIHNPVSALVYAALGNEAKTVIIDGRTVMKDRVILTMEEKGVIDRARAAAALLVDHAGLGSRTTHGAK